MDDWALGQLLVAFIQSMCAQEKKLVLKQIALF